MPAGVVRDLQGDAPLLRQLPFYTDDPAVTETWQLHFEFFNEFDALQSAQLPNVQQNTANFKLNRGLPHHLELDVDAPYLPIFRTFGVQDSAGPVDTNMGLKWNVRGIHQSSRHFGIDPRPVRVLFPVPDSIPVTNRFPHQGDCHDMQARSTEECSSFCLVGR